MRAARRWLTLTLIACTLGIASPSFAQEQIKPYFLLIFDTSGSMGFDGGLPLTQAKSAVNNIINSTGDATFGLMRFRQSCQPGSGGCSCTGANADCDAPYNDGELLVGIFEDNQDTITEWVDGDCDFPSNHFELRASGNTPLGMSLDEAQNYFENGLCDQAWAIEYGRPAIPGCGGASSDWPSPIEQDQDRDPPVDDCRPYAVILLTDGQETCDGTPVNEATQLRTTTVNGFVYDVRTYVIGFRMAAPNAQLEDIACAGGTDNPGDGTNDNCNLTMNAFYPADETDLALALSQIIQDSLLIEVCNGDDDDCDTLIDEGVTNACDDRIDLHVPPPPGSCGPVVEVCDDLGEDEDCDGEVNEGFPLFCDRPGGHPVRDLCADPGETVCDGIDDNCNGLIDENDICAGCRPSPEICDGLDNDCDLAIDEDLERACGMDVGECSSGIQECVAGVWGWDHGDVRGFVPGECSGQLPVPEACNNLDDDCNGVIDGQVEVCGIDTGECQSGNRRCTAGAWGPCIGEIPPVDEICDGLDNDCDGADDNGNPGGGAPCGSDVGECVEGVSACIGGELVCDDVGPSPEICDGLDNDCDGLADEGNPEGGAECGETDVGECELGVEQCLGGEIICVGEVGPQDEICDDRDNDCDGEVDEDNPGGGGSCGSDVGECEPGTWECIDGELVCVDEVGPEEEICDGLDNDCDGAVDEGIPVGAPCGSDIGECEPGRIECVDGEEDCVGGIGPEEEICDGLDNDCDGAIDEGLGLGDPCGSDVGECEPGDLECVDGEIVCVGGVGPADETCDCDDEDCDGEVDEEPGICPPGAACIDCSCRNPCDPNVEFFCPMGLRCTCEDLNGDGECCEPGADPPCGDPEYFCIGDRCDDVVCEEPLVCDPETGDCIDRCRDEDCPEGFRCQRETGDCLEDDCYNFPEDCSEGQVCRRGRCADDPCAGVECDDGQYCSDGECVRYCDDVTCGEGEHCVNGECVDDPCADVECGRGNYCNPETGECEPDHCGGRACPVGRVCDPATGECIDDPCLVTRCPEGYECDYGVCSRIDSGTDSDTDTDGDSDADRDGDRGLATGGGGCVCSLTGASTSSARSAGVWLLFIGLAVIVRRRSR